MVRVITIMDDVYAELYRLKRSKNMSFSEILRYLLKERSSEKENILSLAGSITDSDVDRRSMERIRKYNWGR